VTGGEARAGRSNDRSNRGGGKAPASRCVQHTGRASRAQSRPGGGLIEAVGPARTVVARCQPGGERRGDQNNSPRDPEKPGAQEAAKERGAKTEDEGRRHADGSSTRGAKPRRRPSRGTPKPRKVERGAGARARSSGRLRDAPAEDRIPSQGLEIRTANVWRAVGKQGGARQQQQTRSEMANREAVQETRARPWVGTAGPAGRERKPGGRLTAWMGQGDERGEAGRRGRAEAVRREAIPPRRAMRAKIETAARAAEEGARRKAGQQSGGGGGPVQEAGPSGARRPTGAPPQQKKDHQGWAGPMRAGRWSSSQAMRGERTSTRGARSSAGDGGPCKVAKRRAWRQPIKPGGQLAQ